MNSLVDPRLGLLTSVEPLPRDPRMPASWVAVRALVARTERFATWRADPAGFGCALGDPAAARAAAIGEAVERYCGHAVPTTFRHASWTQLVAAGERALDPTTLALYSTEQYRRPGFPFQPATRDLELAWVMGRDLRDSGPRWVPAMSAYLDYRYGERADEPALHSLFYSGIATGTSRGDAERRALEELIERDATSIWWASGASTHAIRDAGHVTALLAGDRTAYDIRLVEIPSNFAVPVVGALVNDPRSRLLAFGSAARATPQQAATKAVVEAIGSLGLSRQLADPHSETWRAVATGAVEDHVFLPFREDRAYRGACGASFERLTDLPAIAQLYQDPVMQGQLLDRLRPTRSHRLDELPTVAGDARTHYLAELDPMGDIISVDLTTDDVAACGLSVVRVLVAGLVGNAPPAFPLHGSPRLYDVPRRLGWDVQPATESDLVHHPLPLA